MLEEGGREEDRRGEGERWTSEVWTCHSKRRERERETGSNRFSFYSAEFTGASAADRKRRTVKHEAAES